jgi:hypothetical protein
LNCGSITHSLSNASSPTLFDAAFGGLFNVKASSINYSPMEHYCLTHRHPLYHPLISEH